MKAAMLPISWSTRTAGWRRTWSGGPRRSEVQCRVERHEVSCGTAQSRPRRSDSPGEPERGPHQRSPRATALSVHSMQPILTTRTCIALLFVASCLSHPGTNSPQAQAFVTHNYVLQGQQQRCAIALRHGRQRWTPSRKWGRTLFQLRSVAPSHEGAAQETRPAEDLVPEMHVAQETGLNEAVARCAGKSLSDANALIDLGAVFVRAPGDHPARAPQHQHSFETRAPNNQPEAHVSCPAQARRSGSAWQSPASWWPALALRSSPHCSAGTHLASPPDAARPAWSR
jgi:hypothetical protein